MAAQGRLESWVVLEPDTTRQFKLLLWLLVLGGFALVACIAVFASGYWRVIAAKGARALLDLPFFYIVIAIIALTPPVHAYLSTWAPTVEVRAPALWSTPGDPLAVAWKLGGRDWQMGLSRGVKCQLVAEATRQVTERDTDGTKRTVERKVIMKTIPFEPGTAAPDSTSGTAAVLIPGDVPVTGYSKEWEGDVRWMVRCEVQTLWWPTPEDDFKIQLRPRA